MRYGQRFAADRGLCLPPVSSLSGASFFVGLGSFHLILLSLLASPGLLGSLLDSLHPCVFSSPSRPFRCKPGLMSSSRSTTVSLSDLLSLFLFFLEFFSSLFSSPFVLIAGLFLLTLPLFAFSLLIVYARASCFTTYSCPSFLFNDTTPLHSMSPLSLSLC